MSKPRESTSIETKPRDLKGRFVKNVEKIPPDLLEERIPLQPIKQKDIQAVNLGRDKVLLLKELNLQLIYNLK